MPTLHIDNRSHEVKAGKNLLEACLGLGLDLPYFCWHPALGSVGACRQCAVKMFKDPEDQKGRLVMACMEPVKDQLRISLQDPEAVAFRKNIIGWLMTNHPHDCAVCDEGGACHLQDMTVMTGHNYREYRFLKRTYHNQYLGPFLNHEMNRCIHCYRCVRFYRDYAGGKDLDVFGAHNHVYFGRQTEGVLENVFSGNLAEICPTGVFTDKTLKQHYTRKWDMTYGPSICQGCGVGCNIIAGERYGSIRQITTRYNAAVNGYFLCDRGRYGYEYVNSTARIRQPLVREMQSSQLSETALLDYLAGKIRTGKLIGIGSPRASLESNFALQQLVGPEFFYTGVNDTEHEWMRLTAHILQRGPVRTPSLKEVEQADAILVMGEELINTAPMYALAVRQAVWQTPARKAAEQLHLSLWQDAAIREAVQNEKGPLFIANLQAGWLDEWASATYYHAPDQIARMGFAIAQAIHAALPRVEGLSKEEISWVQQVTSALQQARRPLIISGYGAGSTAVLKAVANIAWALYHTGRQAELVLTTPACNSMGMALLGGHRMEAAMDAVNNGEADTVIILENDLYQWWEVDIADAFLAQCKTVILMDHLRHATSEKAHVIIPVGSFAEADGTLVNNEGRAQRYYQVYAPPAPIQESWRWLKKIAAAAGLPVLQDCTLLEDFTEALVAQHPFFDGIQDLSPPASFRKAGQKIPRAPHRYSGRTAMLAHLNVHEPKPEEDTDSPLSFTMEGYRGRPPAALIPFFWAPGWNSVQAINKYQIEIGGALHDGDPGRRLLEPEAHLRFFAEYPEPFVAINGHLWVVPLYHIFGSDMLSRHSAGIEELMPAPYIGMHPEDAAQLGLQEGDLLSFRLRECTYALPVRMMPVYPRGLAAVPRGLPGVPLQEMPLFIQVDEKLQFKSKQQS